MTNTHISPGQALLPLDQSGRTIRPHVPQSALVATARPLPVQPEPRRSLDDVPVVVWVALRLAPFVLIVVAIATAVIRNLP
jgi:hypothetical protein